MSDKITSTARLMSAEELAQRSAAEPGFLTLPAANCFAERAMRLRQLASGHPMGDYLEFMSALAQAQQQQYQAMGPVQLPDEESFRQAAALGMPPLPAQHWQREAVWQDVLRALAQAVRQTAPAEAQETLQRLAGADAVWLEQQADRLLNGVMQGLDMAAAPIVAAALQVYWTHMVQTASAQVFGRIDAATVCPCCGSKPTASVVKAGAERGGQRYLHCSLCGTEWHMVRIKCTHCESTQGLAYQSLVLADDEETESGGRDAVVQAETCDSCGHYLKLVHADRDPMADAVADDLASLTLDFLVSESGKQRHGVNLLLLFGDPEAQAPEPQEAA